MKNFTAFAHTAGGRVIIGVDDITRSPVGVVHRLDGEERLCSLITAAVRSKIDVRQAAGGC